MKALVTGGTGYIGSHTCVELIGRGHDVLIVDNLVNSSVRVLDRLQVISGTKPLFVEADVCDAAAMRATIGEFQPDVVLHFAALKAVGESSIKPLEYYRNNFCGTVTLLEAMRDSDVKRIVYSSSATVYGDPEVCPITESAPRSATNPYGRTKLITEDLLTDLGKADAALQVATLRYFNPVGAHPSGMIGEDPTGTPNNLMPYVCRVAVGRLPALPVFGNDYPTPDGTGVRDYIHVVDLARAHVDAIDALQRRGASLTVNIGTGQGYSVLDVVQAFQAASGRSIPYEIRPRRTGDIARCYADPTLAAQLLGWRSEFGLQRMCEDAWRWQQANPAGFG